MNETVNTYYRENYDKLVKKIKSRVDRPEDAEDVVQEAFGRALKYFNSCSSDFDRWFKVILSNSLKDYQRESKLGGITKNIDDVMDELEVIIPNHIKDHFRNHMDDLSRGKSSYDREIMRLHILFGYNHKEISQILGITTKTVQRHLLLLMAEILELYE